MKNIFTSTYHASKAFANLLSYLLQKFPVFVFIFILVLLNIALQTATTDQNAKILYSIFIAVFSLIVFTKTGNFGESALSLFLGMLAVFTIDWTNANSTLFALIIVPTFVIYFIIDSIKLASRNETILTQAALLIDPHRTKEIGKQLQGIANPPTKHGQIRLLERSEIVRFLVFQRFEIESLRKYLEYIEVLKTIYQLDLETANRFFIAIYYIIKKTEKRNIFDMDLEKLVHFVSNTPIPPHDYANLLISARTVFIKKGLTLNAINIKLENHVKSGYRIEDFSAEI